MLEVAAAQEKKVTMDWSSGWYVYSFFGNTGQRIHTVAFTLWGKGDVKIGLALVFLLKAFKNLTYFLYYNKRYFTEGDISSLERMLEVAAAQEKKVTMDWSSGWYVYSF